MKKLSFTLLTVENNDYQAEQVIAARAAADRLGVQLNIVHTEHDAIAQSARVLELIQAPTAVRTDGIFFEPVGTPLAQAAKAAATAGVGWVVLNREVVDYLPTLRQEHPTTFMFSVTVRHADVGRIQGEQINHLLPKGGIVLHILGPADNDAAKRRTTGMMAVKPPNIEIRSLKGLWTEISGYQAVKSWLNLSIAKDMNVGVVAAQNDAMALGARKAFQEMATDATRDRWLKLPFIGCDGLPNTGQAAVKRGLLTATVVIPPNAGQAVEALARAFQTSKQPAECIRTEPSSYPALTSLKPV